MNLSSIKKYFKSIKPCLYPALVFFAGCATIERPYDILMVKSDASAYVEKAWNLLSYEKYDEALDVTDQCIKLFSEKAKELNSRCDVDQLAEYEGCQLLNDTAVCVYIQSEVYSKTGMTDKAKNLCDVIKESYSNAIVMDKCWPWKPLEVCDSKYH